MEVSRFIRERTPENSAIMVAGFDWSSSIAYYSERKALMLPNFVSTEKLEKLLTHPENYSRPLPIAAYLIFRDGNDKKMTLEIVDKITATIVTNNPTGKIVEVSGCKIVLINSQ